MISVVRIPIRPHLKKFILKHYKMKEPVTVQLPSLLGQQVYSLLRDRTRPKRINDKFTDILTLELCDELARREVRLAKLILINHYFEKVFKSSMYLWTIAQDMEGRPAYHSIREFLRYFGITEKEYAFESAHRAWLRYKNSEYHLTRQPETEDCRAILS